MIKEYPHFILETPEFKEGTALLAYADKGKQKKVVKKLVRRLNGKR